MVSLAIIDLKASENIVADGFTGVVTTQSTELTSKRVHEDNVRKMPTKGFYLQP